MDAHLDQLHPAARTCHTITPLALLAALVCCGTTLGGCGAPGVAQEPGAAGTQAQAASHGAAPVTDGSLSPHFVSWLNANGYGEYGFERSDLSGGSYGGKQSDMDPVTRLPIVFIHGNSDKALGSTAGQTGWSASIGYFLSQGYTSAELYATTWGPADPLQASQQYHSRAYLTSTRAFLQAVLAYTGASQVDVVAHSMGVTLGRKAILGGPASDLLDGGDYDLGAPLTGSVDTFVGIAGSNQGLVACYTSGPTTPTCGDTNGFYPGYMVGLLGPFGVSSILDDENQSAHYEGGSVYSIWSTVDEIIGFGDLVWGSYTSEIPGQDGERRYDAAPYGHFGLKDLTAAVQLSMVARHQP